MPLKARIDRELAASHAAVRAMLGAIPDAEWGLSRQGWSAAETAHHLVLTGRAFLQGGQKVVARGVQARRLGLWRRLTSAPVALVRYRLKKVNAPEPLEPHGPCGDRRELMAQLEALWRDTAEFVAARSDSELRTLAMRHPFFGWTPMGKMFRMMAAHQRRHLDQLRGGFSH